MSELHLSRNTIENNSFDTVVLSQTLQTIYETEKILREVVRVGKESVVSFPNFGLALFRVRHA